MDIEPLDLVPEVRYAADDNVNHSLSILELAVDKPCIAGSYDLEEPFPHGGEKHQVHGSRFIFKRHEGDSLGGSRSLAK